MKQNLFNKLWLRVGMIVAIMTTALAGTVKAETKTDIMFAKGFGGYTTNSFSAAGTDRTAVANSTNATGVTYAMQVFNGSTGAVRGNQNSGASNFSCRNTTSYEGYYISSVSLTITGNNASLDGGTNNRSIVYFGSSAYANPNTTAPSGTSTKSTPNSSGQTTLTWTNSDENVSYFILYNLKTSGTCLSATAASALTVVWTQKSGTPTCATPSFSPAAGTYAEAQSVTLSCETTGATIYYTTDGSVPTNESTKYTAAIPVSATTTIKAIATKSGSNDSEVATATYNIVSIEHAGTAADPYTVADARNAIDALDVTPDDVYATGIVSNIVEEYSSQHSNITFDISTDGETTSDQLRAYRCGGTDAASIQVGDVVVVSGDLTLYGSTYEFSSGCTLISRTSSSSKVAAGFSFSSNSAEADLADLSSFTAPTFSNPNNVTVTFASSNTTVATVASDGTVTPLAKGTTTITATSEETSEYLAGTASYTLTVTNSNVALVTVDANGNTTFDFTDNGWGFPTTKQIEEGSFTNSGYTVKVAGSTGNGFNFSESNSVLIMGKSGAYLTLPAFDYDVEKIEVVGGGSNASSNVVQNIFVGDDAVSTATTGAASVTHTYIIDELYKAAGTIYTLKVTNAYNTQVSSIKVYKTISDNRDDAEIAFSVATLTFTENDTYTAPTFSNPNSVDVTFSTTNGSVASWNNGLVLGGSTGTATITATFDGDANYKPATATLVVTINEDLGFATVKVGSGVYQKITSTSELEAGKRYLIVYWDGTSDDAEVFGGVISSNIGARVTLSIAENKINNNVADAATPVVLQDDGLGNWYIMDGDEFLYWTSGNNLYSSSDVNQNGNTWSIDVDKITNATTTGRRLQYNTGSPRFACYTGTQKDVVLYKELPVTVTLNASGYATFSSNYAVSIPTDGDFTAWQITKIDSDNKITFEQVTGNVKAETGLFLKGTASDDITIEVAASGEELSGNKLVGFPNATNVTEGEYYGLSGNQFKKVGAGTVKAGKALLPAHLIYESNSVKPFTFVFEEDDATGISLMEDGRSLMEDGVIYNLAGQRISKMQKGINIVNGKKILK